MSKSDTLVRELPALRVNQWMAGWSSVKWEEKEHRSQPERWFYQFSISAGYLKALSGVYARTMRDRTSATQDLGVQRRHEKDRSDEIARFIEYGYPWSDLSKKKRQSPEFNNLRKPGWLPTAIVVNILSAKDTRMGRKVEAADLVEISGKENGSATVTLPDGFTGRSWRAKGLPPIEIIDGQHRLWAFEQAHLPDDFELPVVAFKGLDLSWQAYLFYTINIKPKRINASLAFDLYPLLRTEEWLTRFEGHVIYRETRAQELVDLLWSHSESPWHKRINMLGEPGHKGLLVSQAAWVRSLLATFVRSWEGKRHRIGGLFGAPVGSKKQTPSWNRVEQAALLIHLGQLFKEAVHQHDGTWAKVLRRQTRPAGIPPTLDLAFYGPNTLLNQDQGIRALLYVMNDFLYLNADDLALTTWGGSGVEEGDEIGINDALKSLAKQTKLNDLAENLSVTLAMYDWRASDAPELTDQQSLVRAAFRGSGGYRELRKHVVRHIEHHSKTLAESAKKILQALGN